MLTVTNSPYIVLLTELLERIKKIFYWRGPGGGSQDHRIPFTFCGYLLRIILGILDCHLLEMAYVSA